MLRTIKKSKKPQYKNYVLTALSAVLLILSFPDFNLEFLAWFAFVPLFFAIENKKPVEALISGYIFGIIFFLGTIYWLIHVTLPGMIIVVLYLALYFGVFGFICSYYLKGKWYLALISLPSLWAALEWVRAHFITGFGWNLLGYSQSFTLPVIQIADITGVYGVSFLIVMVNCAIFLTMKDLRNNEYYLKSLLAVLLIVFISLYYGMVRVKNIFTGEAITVSVTQGNIPQAKKWDSSFREDILDRYEKLTKQAAAKRPELIIWPETSVPGFMESEPYLFDRVSGLAREVKVPLLVGSPREDDGNKDAYYNSAIFINSEGKVVGRYDKMHLVPFGEYVPLRQVLSFVENFAPSPIGDFSEGKKYTVFDFVVSRTVKGKDSSWRMVKKIKFSTLICFEDIFPDIARKFVAEGAYVLINMTNDAWFGKTCAAYQHVQNSIFRAVENRVNVIRAANTGVSCFINQKGEIINRVKSGNDSIFVEGYATQDIIVARTRTIYTIYGDIFAYLCIITAAVCLFIRMRWKKWCN